MCWVSLHDPGEHGDTAGPNGEGERKGLSRPCHVELLLDCRGDNLGNLLTPT